MFFYHYYLLSIFIILNIINYIFLYKKDKFKIINLIINIISLIFSTYLIFRINIEHISYLNYDMPNDIDYYFKLITNINIVLIITSIIYTVLLSILSFKLEYKKLYIQSIIILVCLYIALFILGIFTIPIIKYVLNFGMLADCLKCYYLNYTTIPLLIAKLRKK